MTDMRKSRYTEEQIIGFIKQAEAGLPIKELCRKGGFSDATFYKWRIAFRVYAIIRDATSNATLDLNVGLCLRRDLMVIDLSRFGLLSGHFYGERSRLASCSKNRSHFSCTSL
jgi:transposase-like protein